MSDFNPDQYLADNAPAPQGDASGTPFNPDTYGSESDSTATPSAKDKFLSLIGDAAKASLTKPLSTFRQYMTDPTAQAKSLPVLMGAAGTIAGPGGMTAGAMVGQNLKDLALTALQDPSAPKTAGQVLLNEGKTGVESGIGEGLGAALSWFKGLTEAGQAIGAAEKGAGIITRAPNKFPTSGNVGEWLNNLEDQFQAGAINSPQLARDAKTITDFIYTNPNIVGKSKEVTVQAARVGKLAQQTLNDLVPGRAAASADFATLSKIKNAASTSGKVAGGLASVVAAYQAFKRFGMAP